MAYLRNQHLIDRGLAPLKGISDGYLDTKVDRVPGMSDMRLRDFSSWIRTTDGNDYVLHFTIYEAQRASMATAVILNTFDDLERPVLEALAPIVPPVYPIGPLDLLFHAIPNPQLKSMNIRLRKEDQNLAKGKAAVLPH
ncbi:putative 7-deoxyloganetin glucosyltransferase [Cocos nucifera]|nr:putative 7-deoxyloganetin glucosyltransferase [Cocos nucifera]